MRERKQRATRERLLEAAHGLFAERGYDGTTMDDIAAGADVSRATAFNYFPRKEEFVVAWILQRRAALAALLASEESAAVEVPDRLRHAFMTLCDNLEANPASRALVRAWVQAGGPLLPDASATAVVFADTLRHGQSHGQLRPGIDADAAGRVLLDAYLGALVRWAAQDDQPLREQLTAVLDLIIDGLRA